ncbi:MAG: hypothetical protein ACU833_02665 [Gammaproteobacteria bacterium]
MSDITRFFESNGRNRALSSRQTELSGNFPAIFSGILTRGNMPHFQLAPPTLDYPQLLNALTS